MKTGWGAFLEGTGPSPSMTFAAACLHFGRLGISVNVSWALSYIQGFPRVLSEAYEPIYTPFLLGSRLDSTLLAQKRRCGFFVLFMSTWILSGPE